MTVFARTALYFDEVARRRSIRRASEHLHIAPSAIDRQILQLEQEFGVALFERLPSGLRLTAAGELLVAAVRRWRRDLARVQTQIDDLRGIRRGEISIALAEGSAQFLTKALHSFHVRYPGVVYRLHVAGSQSAIDLTLSGDCDIGLTYNPPDSRALRVERTLIYELGVITAPDHPLAACASISLIDCCKYPLVIPDESLSLRAVINKIWAGTIGGAPLFSAEANTKEMIKAMVASGVGIAILPSMDTAEELRTGKLVFIPLEDDNLPLSILSIITASGRTLSVSASLLVQHLSAAMETEGAPSV